MRKGKERNEKRREEKGAHQDDGPVLGPDALVFLEVVTVVWPGSGLGDDRLVCGL